MHAPRRPPPLSTYPESSWNARVNSNITPPPRIPSPQLRLTGYPFVRQSDPFMDDTPVSQLSAAERFQVLRRRKGFMDPYLQFTCEPLLRYDNVNSDALWHGAALIVSACCLSFGGR